MNLPELTLAEPGMVLIVSICSVVAGVVRGFTGFGGVAVMALVLIHLYSPLSVLTKLMLIDIVAYSTLLPTTAREFDRKIVLTGIASSAVGVPVGLWLLGVLDPDVTKRVVSGAIGFATVFVISGWRFRRMPSFALQCVLGFFGGVAIGATYIALVMIVFLFAMPLAAAVSRANGIYWGATIAAAIVAAHVWMGNISLDDVWRSALIGLIYLGSVHVGAKMFRRTGETAFRRVVAWLLLILAIAGAAI